MLLMIALCSKGVKLASDFRCRAQLKQPYQHLLHMVENDCSLLQNQRIGGHSNRETLFLHIYECLMSFNSIVMYIFDVFYDNIEL